MKHQHSVASRPLCATLRFIATRATNIPSKYSARLQEHISFDLFFFFTKTLEAVYVVVSHSDTGAAQWVYREVKSGEQ